MNPPRPDWLYPDEYPPPHGQKLLLLTTGCIATTGTWKDEDCRAWLPLPDDKRKGNANLHAKRSR